MTNAQAEKSLSDITEGLCAEISVTVDLIRRLGGGVVLEEFPGALQEGPLPADALDTTRGAAPPEPGASTRLALIDAADALGETLAQLDATVWNAHPLRARLATS